MSDLEGVGAEAQRGGVLADARRSTGDTVEQAPSNMSECVSEISRRADRILETREPL